LRYNSLVMLKMIAAENRMTLDEFSREIEQILKTSGRPIYSAGDTKYSSLMLKAICEWADLTGCLTTDRIEFTPQVGYSAYPFSAELAFEYPLSQVRQVYIEGEAIYKISEGEKRSRSADSLLGAANGKPTQWWVDGQVLYFDKPFDAVYDNCYISGGFYPQVGMALTEDLPIEFNRLLSLESYVAGRIGRFGAVGDEIVAMEDLMKLGIDTAHEARAKTTVQSAGNQHRFPSRTGRFRIGNG